jgi:HPt (histidine-containing phosphotransfer) domain-containing protein
MTVSAPNVPARLLEFFVTEAVSYAETLREIMWLPAADRDTGQMLHAARGMRGAATMVRLSDLAVVAGRMERIARSLHTRRTQWTEPLSYSLQAVLYELPELISAAGVWGPGESERAAAIADALHAFAPAEDKKANSMVVPIARLFHDDAGPHVIYVAVTPQTQFEQQLREPAPDKGDGAAARADRPGPTPAAARTAPARPQEAAQAAPRQRRAPQPPPRTPTPPQARPPAGGERTPPRGRDLQSLISQGLAGFEGMELDSPPVAAAAGGLVPIESLLYSGRAALARAREIRAAQAAAAREPTPEELDELMDLMELAATA